MAKALKDGAKYRVALIGCGRAGLPRARAFDMHPLCQVVALADTDAENLEMAALHIPNDLWTELRDEALIPREAPVP